jgi:putative acetyltransferase
VTTQAPLPTTEMEGIYITRYTDAQREGLLKVWEESVLATHDFLTAGDFREIKAEVYTVNFNMFDVYCLMEERNVIGFVGVYNGKVETLFLSPAYFRKGLGKKLMNFAVQELGADKVDVNESNTRAVEFYKRCGFEVYERTNKDDQGRNYPLLRMKLT